MECPFCKLDISRIILEDDLVVAIQDGYPISRGHSLVVPRRHVASLFDATNEEQSSMLEMVRRTKVFLDKQHNPAGYNIGLNEGKAAGQTVMHVHLHVIPRYAGDRADPRGGIRWIIPEKADYWSRGTG